jgi:hypothetical protein
LNDDYEKRHQAKTPAELRQFVGQLGGLQNEHQALRLRTSLSSPPCDETADVCSRRHGPDGTDHGCYCDG